MNSPKRGRRESLINECLYIRQLKDISSFVGCIYAINSEYMYFTQPKYAAVGRAKFARDHTGITDIIREWWKEWLYKIRLGIKRSKGNYVSSCEINIIGKYRIRKYETYRLLPIQERPKKILLKWNSLSKVAAIGIKTTT